MKKMLVAGSAAVVAVFLSTVPSQGQNSANMTFFITSAGSGNGANLGGLEGADKICQQRAAAVGAGNRTWRAYLSTSASGNQPAVNARDRIGKGPWQNAKGVAVAQNVDDLHSDNNRLGKENSLTEKGAMVNGRGDTPNTHDILTGSDSHGRSMLGAANTTTCNNWTSNAEGRAMVGHHDRLGGANASWNAVHLSSGCSQQNLVQTGGNGLFYCFAAN